MSGAGFMVGGWFGFMVDGWFGFMVGGYYDNEGRARGKKEYTPAATRQALPQQLIPPVPPHQAHEQGAGGSPQLLPVLVLITLAPH